MSELLKEFLVRLFEKKNTPPVEKKPSNAKFSSGGKWYSDAQHTDYVGRMVRGRWVKATPEEKKREKQDAADKSSRQVDVRPSGEQPSRKSKTGDAVAKPTGQIVDAKTASRTLYGKNGTGKLLIDSPDAQSILDNGFIPGEGAPPGSAGSNFNENMSDEAAMILTRFPDMDEATLTRVLFERIKDTKLAAQQAETSVVGSKTYEPQGTGKKPSRIVVPADITDEQHKIIWINCVITARSGRKKYIRALQGVQVAQKEIGFGKIKKLRTFGGAAGDLQRAKEMVESAKKCYIHDDELGLVELPKEVLVDWINRSGGGENAADTVVMTMDSNGNLLYDGWSDKKTLGDIQGNSTLNEEYTAMASVIATLAESGRISERDEQTALSIITSAQQFSDELEAKYADTSIQLADYFMSEFDGGLSQNQMDLYIGIINHPDPKIRKKLNLKKHWDSFKTKVDTSIKSSGGKDRDKRIQEFYEEAKKKKLKGDKLYWYVLNRLAQETLLTSDERKILERISSTILGAKAIADSTTPPKKGSAQERVFGPFVKAVRSMEDTDRLDIKTGLRRRRTETIQFQVEQIEKLNKIKITNSHGDRVRLGDHLEARSIIGMLHIDKIDMPSTEPGTPEYFEQVLVRSTQLVLEGIPVTPKTLRECLKVENSREFEKNFQLLRDPNDENTVFVYAIRGKERVLVARKQYRSKSGTTGKTGTVIVWEKEMQNCFDTKGAEK